MANHRKSSNSSDRDKVENVLTFGGPRERPGADAKQTIYEAVKSEWLSEVRSSRRNRLVVLSGIAASAILAAGFAFHANQPTTVAVPALNAFLIRVTGDTISANGAPISADNYEGRTLPLKIGDTLTTYGNSRAAVSWNENGSLRVDHDSQISVLGNGSVRLNYGTLYYDSKSLAAGASASTPLTIDTSLGTVSHVGTQFIADLSESGLRISVREGNVKFDGGVHSFSVIAGTTVGISPDNAVEKENISATDHDWEWTTAVAPRLTVDGQSTLALINWISRETGLTVQFKTLAARNFAYNDRIVGLGTLDPLQALSTIPNVTSLRYKIDDKTIIVSEQD